MRILSLLLLGSAFSILFSCKSESNEDLGNNPETFSLETQIANTYDHGIIDQIDVLIQSSEDLENEIQNFVDIPNTENLTMLQNKWTSTVNTWKPLEVLTVGSFALTSRIATIHFWPINTATISQIIEQNEKCNWL